MAWVFYFLKIIVLSFEELEAVLLFPVMFTVWIF